MRFVVLGGGGIGSIVAAHLAKEHKVTLVTRGEHLRVIRERGLRIEGLASFEVQIDVSESASGPCDLLILATKTPDTEQALEAVEGLQPDAAISLQNGVIKDTTLAGVFGADHVLGATTMIGAIRTAPGVARLTLDGITIVGELDGTMSPRLEAIESAWNVAGLPMSAVPDVLAHEWAKQALQAAASPLAVVADVTVDVLYGTRPLADLMVTVIREAVAVARALGIEVADNDGYGFNVRAVADETWDQAVQRVVATGTAMTAGGRTPVVSMLQDVRAGRRTELDETAGYVVREAERLGVPVPTLAFACDVVRAVETTGSRIR
jgi:2-dehydropantoate 2-reductase